MMRFILSTLVVATALALTGGVALAQGPPGLNLRAEVPFEFIVDGRTFPPGSYEVETLRPDADAPVLTIQRATADESGELRFVNVMTVPAGKADAAESPKLVFERVGDLNFLEKVVPDTGTVREISE
jgi:hypothetical protein